MKKSIVLFSIFLLFPVLLFGVEPRIVINTGHTAAVNSLAYHEEFDLLFSAGKDGTVRAWNTNSRNLVYFLRVSHHPIEKISLNPVQPHIAVVEKRSGQSHKLSVWNWKTNEKLFDRDLEEGPLSLGFSPKGSYLVYSITDWDSITFLDARTGARLDLLRDGFGIVSDFIISSSEKTLMTYSPSGNIQYWNIQAGSRKEKISTKPDISQLTFTNNLRYMVGWKNERVYIIDLISGDAEGSLFLPEVKAIANNPISNTIAFAVWENKELSIYLVELENRIKIKKRIPFSENNKINDMVFFMNGVFIADGKNTIDALDVFWETQSTLGARSLAPINDIDFSTDKMVLTTPENALVFRSDFFTKFEGEKPPKYMYFSDYEHPFNGNTAIEKLSNNKMLLWQQGDDSLKQSEDFTIQTINSSYNKEDPVQSPAGRMGYFNPSTGVFQPITDDFLSSSLLRVTIQDDELLTLEKDGTCRLLEKDTFHELFTYSSYGLQTVNFAGESIIAGKTRSTGFNAPLIQINPETGETVPIYDNNILVYDLLYDRRTDKFYSLGLTKLGTSFTTVLKEHSGRNYDLSYTLFSFSGEDLGASIVADKNPPAIYSTLGYEKIRAFSYSKQWSFDHPTHIPRKVFIYEDHVYSLNSDSSISVWDKKERTLICDIYIYEDLSWVVQMPTGHFFASEDGEKNIQFYLDFIPYNGDMSDYKLETEKTEGKDYSTGYGLY